jgi:hypothetical protein
MKMKNIILLILINVPFFLFAQENALGIYPGHPSSGISYSDFNNAVKKVENWATQNGYTLLGKNSGTGLKIDLLVNDARTVNAGMRNLTVVEGEILVSYQSSAGNSVFGQYRKAYKGSGTSASQAKTNFYNAIPGSNSEFGDFLAEMEDKVVSYYNENCTATMDAANLEIQNRSLSGAVETLMAVPAQSSCKQNANSLLNKLYQQERDRLCEKFLANAKANAAQKKYDIAVAYLQRIDPESSCFVEVNSFISEMKTSVNIDVQNELDALKSFYEAIGNQDNYRFIVLKDHLAGKF